MNFSSNDGFFDSRTKIVNILLASHDAQVKNGYWLVIDSRSEISSSSIIAKNSPSSAKILVPSASSACTKDLPSSSRRYVADGQRIEKSFMSFGASLMTWCTIGKGVSAGIHCLMTLNVLSFPCFSMALSHAVFPLLSFWKSNPRCCE